MEQLRPGLWIERHGALVVGDTLLGDGDFRRGLSPLLELPVELILPTHGDPVIDGAAERLRLLLT